MYLSEQCSNFILWACGLGQGLTENMHSQAPPVARHTCQMLVLLRPKCQRHRLHPHQAHDSLHPSLFLEGKVRKTGLAERASPQYSDSPIDMKAYVPSHCPAY